MARGKLKVLVARIRDREVAAVVLVAPQLALMVRVPLEAQAAQRKTAQQAAPELPSGLQPLVLWFRRRCRCLNGRLGR